MIKITDDIGVPMIELSSVIALMSQRSLNAWTMCIGKLKRITAVSRKIDHSGRFREAFT